MDQPDATTVTFRCPPELESVLPRPMPAVLGLPDWFKALPQKAFNPVLQDEQMTVKKCPPFIDAMTSGFLLPLAADLKVENGEFSWDRDVPAGDLNCYGRSPIDFHDGPQVAGTPLFDDDQFIIKFNNYWTIELPPGYSLLVTHPINRHDLPFTTLTGSGGRRPLRRHLHSLSGAVAGSRLQRHAAGGTPVAQCLPLKRDRWTAQYGVTAGEAATRLRDTTDAIKSDYGVYRRRFRVANTDPERSFRLMTRVPESARTGRSV